MKERGERYFSQRQRNLLSHAMQAWSMIALGRRVAQSRWAEEGAISPESVNPSAIKDSDLLLSPPLSVPLRTPTVCAGDADGIRPPICAPPPTPDHQEPPVWKDVGRNTSPSRRVLFQSGFGSSPRLVTLFSKRRNNTRDTCNISLEVGTPNELRDHTSETWPKRAGDGEGRCEGEEVRVTASPMLVSELVVDEGEWGNTVPSKVNDPPNYRSLSYEARLMGVSGMVRDKVPDAFLKPSLALPAVAVAEHGRQQHAAAERDWDRERCGAGKVEVAGTDEKISAACICNTAKEVFAQRRAAACVRAWRKLAMRSRLAAACTAQV